MSSDELRALIREEVDVIYAQRIREDMVAVRNAARATKEDIAWRSALLILLGFTVGSAFAVALVRLLPLVTGSL